MKQKLSCMALHLSIALPVWTHFALNSHAMPLTYEGLLTHASDGAEGQLFHTNPAASPNSRSSLELSRVQVTSQHEVETGATGDGEERSVQRSEAHNFVGAKSVTSNGTGVGVIGQFSGRDTTGHSEGSRNEITEGFRARAGTALFGFNLSPQFRLGFSYRILEMRTDILGNWTINGNDRTRYRSLYSGYGVGLAFDHQQFFVGAVYMPPARGKAMIEGESKLFAAPGVSGGDLVYRISPAFAVAASVYHHVYKMNDARTSSTSPEDQRRISLLGFDLESLLLPAETRKIGLAAQISQGLRLRATLVQTRLVFDGNENRPPQLSGDSVKSWQANSILIGLRAQRGQAFGEVSAGRMTSATATLRDGGNWYGARDYRGFEASASQVAVIIGSAI